LKGFEIRSAAKIGHRNQKSKSAFMPKKNVCQCKNHFSVLTSKSFFVTFSLLVGTVDPFKIDQDDEKERKCDTDGTDGQETKATYRFIEY
jgi:hypothetical protein